MPTLFAFLLGSAGPLALRVIASLGMYQGKAKAHDVQVMAI